MKAELMVLGQIAWASINQIDSSVPFMYESMQSVSVWQLF